MNTKAELNFRQFLKKAGKRGHVIDGLVGQVAAFEDHLTTTGPAGLEAVTKRAIRDYVKTLDPRLVKERMRGLALYYKFAGNDSLAQLASDIREQGIASTRHAFKLRGFRGVDPKEVARLEAIGIVTIEHLLAAGKTPEARQQLARRTGIARRTILELVKLSDLSRLGAVKSIRARLYYDAGLDTPAKFSQWEPDALREYLVKWVARTGFDGLAPLPKEIRNAIASAARLPQIVVYD